jgi:hypothetical protein
MSYFVRITTLFLFYTIKIVFVFILGVKIKDIF